MDTSHTWNFFRAGGFGRAINARARINIPFGTSLTGLAGLWYVGFFGHR